MRTLVVRALCSVLVGTALLALTPPPEARASGRLYSRCVHVCLEFRQACNVRCATDCIALFPSDTVQHDACIDVCYAVCADLEQDCKVVCRAYHPPPIEP